MTYKERIKKALPDLESCLKLNYSELAKKYNLKQTIIVKQH
jgi:hypothetical protein